ncbi:3770_t:CDS:2 [Diversispora eburnea]|uniref:3770_t:CDS:1 n=1 Tax=Diversispora eburnea TaxID=1213867 RepID=A0A9N9F065_9GLOM|nr:3770_t:CDS:2 [Diversispora eburnea]
MVGDNMGILAQATNYATKTPFRDAERNFKSRLPPPNFSNVIDFDNIDGCSVEIKNKIVQVDLSHDLGKEEYKELFGQFDEIDEKIDLNRKKAYLIRDFPGFIFIRNPFTPEAQKYVIKRCLKDFAKYPNKSNLDTHYALPKEGIWKLHEKVYNGQLNENDKLTRKLRWITLGYQYHWPTKTYHLDRQLKFPQDIGNLTTAVVKVIDGIKLPDDDNFIHKYEVSKWKPEAGVINYYQLKDNLMAHVDKSEINMNISPIAIYLRSGDISIMCGIRRACVPRILEGTLPEYLKSNNLKEDPEWDIYANYMLTSRININVRQVF